jgi:hypothetical protein
MARSKWRGDTAHLLPAQQVEPYRLWFEFLKLAHQDPTLKINRKYYAAWGDITHIKFDEWWTANWQKLFATDIGVRVVEVGTKIKAVEGELIVRLPLSQSPKRTLSQVSKLLLEHGASDRLKDMVEGQYRLSVGDKDKLIHPSTRLLRNLTKIRLLLNIYRFWLSHGELDERRRLEATAISYFKWADGWNQKVKSKKWNRSLIEVPFALRTYVSYLEKRGSKKRGSLYEIGDFSDQRRQMARYIRKARKIAENTAKGVFTGKYE